MSLSLRRLAMQGVSLSLLSLALIEAIAFNPVAAQSIIPAPSGTDTIINLDGNRIDISGGKLSGDGANLFHSFTEFGLSQNQIANFLSNPNIQNILAGVRGGNASVINGLIQLSGGNSNLFLINPAGILFGAGAHLNVPASFTATTATGIGFGNAGWLNITDINNYAALAGTPSLFAFNTPSPGIIVNAAQLAVEPGQNLTMLGGTVVSTGQLSAPGGNITVASVSGGNWIRISQDNQLLNLEIQPIATTQTTALAFTPLTLAQLLTGNSDTGNATGLTVNSNGSVQLTGSGIPVENGNAIAQNVTGKTAWLLSANDLNVGNITIGPSDGAVILEAAGDIAVTEAIVSNGSDIYFTSGGAINTSTATLNASSNGASGAIALEGTSNITTGELNASSIEGNGGKITLYSKNGAIDTSGQSVSSTAVNGNGGDITFYATNSNITTSEVNASSTGGNGGAINVYARSNINTLNSVVGGNLNFVSRKGVIDTTAGSLNSSGAIALHAFSNVTTGDITSNGGTIKLTSYRGNLNTTAGKVNSSSLTGSGGAIALHAFSNVTTGEITSNGGTIKLISYINNMNTKRKRETGPGEPHPPLPESPPFIAPPIIQRPLIAISPQSTQLSTTTGGEPLLPQSQPPSPEPQSPPSTQQENQLPATTGGEPLLPQSQPPSPEPQSPPSPSTQPSTQLPGTTGGEPLLPQSQPPSPELQSPPSTQQGNQSSTSTTLRQANSDNQRLADGVRGDNTQPTQSNQLRLVSLAEIDCLGEKPIREELRNADNVSRYTKAIACYQQKLQKARQERDRFSEGQALYNLGSAYFSLGDYTQATEHYQQHLGIAQQLKNSLEEALTLGGLGATYSALGDYPKAIHYYEKSLAITRKISAPQLQGNTIRNLGIAYLAQEDYSKAIYYQQQSLTTARAIQDRQGEGIALGNLGIAYFSQGEYRKAIEYHTLYLSVARELQDRSGEGRALGNLGLAYYGLKNFTSAIEYHQQHLSIARELQDRAGEGQALNNLGDALLQAGKLKEAEETLLAAIQVWESLRARLGNNDINKISIFETQATTYTTLQEALIAQNKVAAALEIAERGRARAFVELLASSVSTKSIAQNSIKPPTLAQIKQIAKEQNATLVEYSIVRNGFQVKGKRQIKESKLYIWVIQPTGEVAFRQVDLQPLWQQENTTIFDLVSNTRQSIGVRGLEEAVVTTEIPQNKNKRLQQLYQLLIQPIADVLPKDPNARVIFIPHESLFLVPFPALQQQNGKYLIEQHTILTAPSIQVLDFTHSQQRHVGTSNVLIVGNPTMPKVKLAPNLPLVQLPPLPSAKQEAIAIANILNTKALTGNQATKAAIRQQMSQARIVHLATHGLLDDVLGMGVPGAIALAPSENDNGLLTASEILDLKLNADLVVLSACNTGGGKVTGDGVIGLSRSLISAGAKSAIVSLWSVPDAPTAFLMTEFYRNLQVNPDRATALRSAMLTTMKQHPDPSDWAAFTLIGEAE